MIFLISLIGEMSIVIIDNSGVFKNKGEYEYFYIKRSDRNFKYRYFTMNKTILSPDAELHINTDIDPDHSLRITNTLNPTIYISYSGDPIIESVNAEHKIIISHFKELEILVFNVVYRDNIFILDEPSLDRFISTVGHSSWTSRETYRRRQIQVCISGIIADIIKLNYFLISLNSK